MLLFCLYNYLIFLFLYQYYFVIVLKNGKNVYPEELEILINKIAGVSESFVYGKLEDDGDYKISAKIVSDKDIMKDVYGLEDKQEIRDKLWQEVKIINKTMPKYKYIFYTNCSIYKKILQYFNIKYII